MMLDFSRCRLPPFAHQREDVAWLIERPYAFVTNEMRTGKTKECIDAAQFLFEMEKIKRVVVVAPAPVRDVWFDKELGELAKHLWTGLPATVTEFHARTRTWVRAPEGNDKPRLDWYVTNYEFLRSRARLAQLLPVCDAKTLLILDESSYVKNYAAQQTKACVQLRRACGRVVLLNGTPIFHSPMDLFSQGNLLHLSVLDCKYVTHFKARYAIQEPVLGYGGRAITDPRGRAIQKVAGWTNLDDLQRRFAPCTIRRLQKDCLDLPAKLDSVMLTATLTPETWRAYKDMRDEMVVWLKSGRVVSAATAAVKALRLSQITSGFIGGIESANIDEPEDGLLESLNLEGINDRVDNCGRRIKPCHWVGSNHTGADADSSRIARGELNRAWQEVGREKLDVMLWFIEQRLEADPNLHLVAWCLFRAELFRMLDAVRERFPQFEVAAVHGGQKKAERLRALSLLKPETSPIGPTFVGGTYGTGSFGLDMCAAHTSVNLSSGYSPGRHAQSADRLYGPGQKFPIAYFDIIAVGPRGQKTIDHNIITSRLNGEDVAARTSAAWVRVLTKE